MKNVNIYIPDELIAMSQRNPFRELNNTQDGLEVIREAVTVIFSVKVSAASAAAVAAAAAAAAAKR